MNRPQLQTITYLNYRECENYIAYKLGVKTLRDFAGKYIIPDHNPDAEYQDFWHCICDNQDVHNGSFIEIESKCATWPDWALPIVKAFEEEFGSDQEYLVQW